MASRDSNVGIKQLYEAEEKAKEIVERARKEKTQLLKQAREEAEKEIKAFREKREAEYKEFSNKYTTGSSQYTQQLAANTKESIDKISKDIGAHGDAVINLLLKYVTEVHTD